MKCRQFLLQLEDYLARHPGPPPQAVPSQLEAHAGACPACLARWNTAVRSRLLLIGLRLPEAPPDPYFATRVYARIRQIGAKRTPPRIWGLRVAWKDLVIASVLFAGTLGSFVYNFQRIETPNADEAIVLDVPHLNPQHPSDDHAVPKPADVMLSLMN